MKPCKSYCINKSGSTARALRLTKQDKGASPIPQKPTNKAQSQEKAS